MEFAAINVFQKASERKPENKATMIVLGILHYLNDILYIYIYTFNM